MLSIITLKSLWHFLFYFRIFVTLVMYELSQTFIVFQCSNLQSNRYKIINWHRRKKWEFLFIFVFYHFFKNSIFLCLLCLECNNIIAFNVYDTLFEKYRYMTEYKHSDAIDYFKWGSFCLSFGWHFKIFYKQK